ncbi:hypothetical protein C5167_046230 [Papaver somniferum]|uniref:Methyltransferase type 11 domain-containing protein n=1 Tax=Papaver somniferum TaxID=3469 RepID=A0A4Y7LD72_PAPSO|nr:uncharacterized protein LOC113323450 [Papaver somniferum]RZC83444.1 hypothetical protein C5167_046230 [Papaver somniferum]
MGIGMGLNLLLLLAMVATNILSLYHLSSSLNKPVKSSQQVPDHLIHQLNTIRATINHLTHLRSTTSDPDVTSKPPIPSDLLLYAHISPIASACHDHPELLHRYMNYTPFSLCPFDTALSESLILRGCHPLPRRRCFTPTPSKPISSSRKTNNPFPSSFPDSAVAWASYVNCKSFQCLISKYDGFDMKVESSKFVNPKSDLDLPISQLLQIAKSASSVIRLGLDVGAGTGTFAARMKLHNVTVLSTSMNLGAPYNEVIALRGIIPLHVPLQQRFPIFDGIVDLVRFSHAVNRWIPTTSMDFLFYDVDRVLRSGGYLWLDHFFSKRLDLEFTYSPMIKKLGYKIVKWATDSKNDSSGIKNDEVYLTALLQKPVLK